MSLEVLLAGRELDAATAEKVMGCEVKKYPEGWPFCNCQNGPHGDPDSFHCHLKHYSTQIKWAWEVWERLRERWLPSLIDCGGHGVRVELHSDSPDREDIAVTAQSAELAICYAALKAAGV